MAKTCAICGKPSGMYPLCNACFKLRDIGEIVKCEECGTWHKVDEPCNCEDVIEDFEDEEEVTGQCLLCDNDAGPYLFCKSCYHKYKDRSIDIRITNCRDIQIIDEYGNKTRKTKDGRKVRSLSEKIIIDYFFDHFVRVVYEKTIPYINEKGEDAELHPDFYLPDYDLYIEFNGLTTKSYLRKKDYVNKIYQEKGYKVEILESQDLDDVEAAIEKILSKHKK